MNHDAIYRHIGQIIRRKRKQLDQKQKDLAPKLGISRASLANIETGRQKVLVHQLYLIAAALGMSPNELLPPPQQAASLDADLPLPSGLKPQQKEQIARLLAGTPSEQPLREERHVKKTKR